MTVRKIFQYIMLAVGVFSAASCTSDLDNTTVTIDGKDIRFVVGDFPAFGESGTRAVGTEDPGKTEWAVGDEILVMLGNNSYGDQYATVTFNGEGWELKSGTLVYREGDPAYIPHVYYAPDYEWVSGELALKDGKDAGTDEYIEGTGRITNDGQEITVSFSNTERNYSRLRIATLADTDITVAIEYITPAGSPLQISTTYTVHSDAKGNAYLYGKFVRNSTVSVKYGDVALTAYTFSGPTDMGKSYALDATVLLLEGMSLEEIDAAVEKMASEVNAGKTNFNILLSPEPDVEVFDNIRYGLAEAWHCTINLTLMGCEKIPAGAFMGCNWLKSIALPAVTEIGESAFYGCTWLQKVVFGSPLTKVYGNNGSQGIFDGCPPKGIDLILSSQQKVMSGSQVEGKYEWTPGGTDYNDSVDHKYKKILGYEGFNSVSVVM